MSDLATVYIVLHAEYDDLRIRGVYANRAAAEASLVTRTPSGAKSRAADAHDDWCCDIEEWEVVSP